MDHKYLIMEYVIDLHLISQIIIKNRINSQVLTNLMIKNLTSYEHLILILHLLLLFIYSKILRFFFHFVSVDFSSLPMPTQNQMLENSKMSYNFRSMILNSPLIDYHDQLMSLISIELCFHLYMKMALYL